MPGSDLYLGSEEVQKIEIGHDAFLYRIGDRFFVSAWDDKTHHETWQEIQAGDTVLFGAEPLVIPRQLFFGDERVTLKAYDLVSSRKIRTGLRWREKIFCNHLSFQALPGTITAIMGPSGAGKTVLMNLLSGYLSSPQNIGRVWLNQKFDLHRDRRALGRWIGYVPQDDTLLPNLTARQSLDSCFRLRYAGVESSLKTHIIEDACRRAGFSADEIHSRLDTRVGSPDDKTLSGGQRKRINIAHELIRNPLLLFLDEPTSGLSSVDADNVIQSLRDLCTASQITIVLTIHQPSVKSFKLLDHLLVVNYGGNLAYFGPADEAVVYFNQQARAYCPPDYMPPDNPAELILETVEHWTNALAAAAPQTSKERAAAEIADVYRHDPHAAALPGDDKPVKRSQDIPRLTTSFWQQFLVLWQRNRASARADQKTRLFQMLQPIVIALMILIAFAGYRQDYHEEDIFSRVGYALTDQSGTIFMSQDVPAAQQKAYQLPNVRLISEGTATRQAAVFFLLIASCIWFGIINACKEIVDERAVLRREAKSTLRLSAYFAAKIVFLGWICIKQTILLVGILFVPQLALAGITHFTVTTVLLKLFLSNLQLLAGLTIPAVLGIMGILCLTAVLSSWWGLAISALAPNQKTALTVVPLMIIPQLVFGGLIRPIKDLTQTGHFVLTAETFDRLQTELPADVRSDLQVLQDQHFTSETRFLDAVRTLVGQHQTVQIKARLLRQARLASHWETVWAALGRLHHLMLQKWSFQAVLLYHSLAEPTVLKKVLNFNRYREYEFIQFETVTPIDLFFQVGADDKRELLTQTLLGMVGAHALLLLLPTYFWLRRKFLR